MSLLFTAASIKASFYLLNADPLLQIYRSKLLALFLLQSKMPETAEAVSATLTTNRNCTIEITNVSSNYCLINPK